MTGMVLERFTKICLALPATARTMSGEHATFVVRKRVFAYFLNNHHGDGIVGIACKTGPGDNTALVDAQPERFYLPAYIAHRGWVGLRLDRGKIDWEEVRELVTASYALAGPKKKRK